MTIEIKRPSYESKQIMTVPFEMKAFSEDEKYFYFEGYLSTFGNEDRGGDIVEQGAFDESLKVHTPVLLAFHKTSEPAGVFDSLVPDKIGLYVKGRMPKDDTYVSGRLIPQMQIGSIRAMSIGYSVWEQDGSMEVSNGVRHLKKVFLWEGSLVTIPMNDQALIKTKSAIPFHDELPISSRKHNWDRKSALERVRDWAGSKDGCLNDQDAQAKYRKAFLWFGNYDDEDKGILPVADIIDGKLTIVPAAVFAAAGKIMTSYKDVDDRKHVVNTIEKYYKKMGLDSPFGKTFRIDDFKAFEERTLEKLLRDGVCMSEKNSKMLVSYIKAGLGRDASEPDQRDVENDGLKSILGSIKKFNNQFNEA